MLESAKESGKNANDSDDDDDHDKTNLLFGDLSE